MDTAITIVTGPDERLFGRWVRLKGAPSLAVRGGLAPPSLAIQEQLGDA